MPRRAPQKLIRHPNSVRQQVFALHHAGKVSSQISEELDIPHNTIIGWLYEANLRPRLFRGQADEPRTFQRTSKYKEEQYQEVCALVAAGVPTKEIVAGLPEIPDSTLHGWIRRYKGGVRQYVQGSA